MRRKSCHAELMEPALAYVELEAEQLVGTKKALCAALTDVDAKVRAPAQSKRKPVRRLG